jgi:hypothetical protein
VKPNRFGGVTSPQQTREIRTMALPPNNDPLSPNRRPTDPAVDPLVNPTGTGSHSTVVSNRSSGNGILIGAIIVVLAIVAYFVFVPNSNAPTGADTNAGSTTSTTEPATTTPSATPAPSTSGSAAPSTSGSPSATDAPAASDAPAPAAPAAPSGGATTTQ